MKNKQLLLKNSSSQYKVLQGFTLVELSLTIAIVAGLTTAVVSVMNPVELSAQMRDGQRIAAMGTLRETLGVLIAENPNLPTGFGLTNFAYISLPDTHSDCRNIITNLPARTDGRLYHCVTAANLMRIDGAGWIPVNFTTIRGGGPISVLPIDPINNTSFFYEYLPSAHHRYAFSTRIESIRQRVQNPSGIFTTRFTAPFNFRLSANPSTESIVPGGSVFTTITTSLISGTTQEVSFSASGLPTGAVATFSPTSCSPLCSSTLNIITNANTPVGIYNVAVIATSAGVTRETIYIMSIANTLSFLLSTSVIGTGTITSSPAGINCTSGVCNAAYTSGTSVTLTASPGSNHTFAGWSGACTGTGPCVLTMSEARSVAATFSQIPAPTISIGASPASIASGSSSTITWSSTNTTSCSWTAGFTGPATLSGSQSTGALTVTTTYTLSCTGAGGTTLSSTTVTVTAAPTFTLTTSVTGSGTITSVPAGINCGADCTESYASGTSVTLTATPGANQSFAGWSGACTGPGTCAVSMTQARSVTATFSQITHTLTVNSSGAAGVAITGTHAGTTNYTHTVAQGATVAITAPATSGGQNFASWTGCDSVTTTTTCNLTMNAARTVTTNYTAPPPPAPTATCTVASSTQVNVSWTNVAGETNFTVYRCTTAACTPAAPAVHTATADVLTWSNTGLTASTMYRYSVRASNAGGSSAFSNVVECTTSAIMFTLTTSVTGSGTITSSPAGINCGADCTESYASGTSVTLTATPGANHAFAGWSGACTGPGTCAVSMTQARSVTATFSQITHTLTVNSSGAAGVAITGTHAGTTNYTHTVAQGATVAITAPATSGGQNFASWTGCDSVTTTTTCNLTMNAARTVTANYTTPTFTLTTSVTGSGTITSSPAGINCGADCTESYASGTSVTLTATPGANHAFAGWSGACTGPGSCVVSMTQERTVTATFSQIPAPTISISASPASIASGSSSTITWSSTNATSCSWTAGFSGAAALSGSQSTGALTVTTTYTLSCAGAGGTTLNSTTVTVTAAPTFTLTTSVTRGGTITSSPAGVNCTPGTCNTAFNQGTVVTLTATPWFNYMFTGWSGDCMADSECSLTMNSNRSVTANFTCVFDCLY